jgi:hypothetical protein
LVRDRARLTFREHEAILRGDRQDIEWQLAVSGSSTLGCADFTPNTAERVMVSLLDYDERMRAASDGQDALSHEESEAVIGLIQSF